MTIEIPPMEKHMAGRPGDSLIFPTGLAIIWKKYLTEGDGVDIIMII